MARKRASGGQFQHDCCLESDTILTGLTDSNSAKTVVSQFRQVGPVGGGNLPFHGSLPRMAAFHLSEQVLRAKSDLS